jgi:thioesterase domain-containing protein
MASNFLLAVRRAGDRPPLFYVPSAGTTALSLVHLARALKSPHPFYSFEFLELATGGERPTAIAEIGSLCVQEIRTVQKAGPYFVGGHCWGGAGYEVASLTLLESVPPVGCEVTSTDIALAARTKAVSELREQVREKLSRLPAQLAERFGPISWELIELARHYRAKTRITAPVFLIRSSTHPKSVFGNWGHLTSGGFEEQVVPGDAFSLLAAPIVKTVGAKLDEVLRSHRDRSLSR